jgi:hypothetical protein
MTDLPANLRFTIVESVLPMTGVELDRPVPEIITFEEGVQLLEAALDRLDEQGIDMERSPDFYVRLEIAASRARRAAKTPPAARKFAFLLLGLQSALGEIDELCN